MGEADGRMKLESTFVVLHPDQSATPIEFTPTVFEELNRRFDGFEGERAIELREPDEFAIVPRGTWHTAKIAVATKMLFVTPGAGTEHKRVG
jgi:hypothetical protein